MENQERIFYLDDVEYKYEEQSPTVKSIIELLDETQEKRTKLIKKITCIDASMRGLQMQLADVIEYEKKESSEEEPSTEDEVTEVH